MKPWYGYEDRSVISFYVLKHCLIYESVKKSMLMQSIQADMKYYKNDVFDYN